MGLNVNISYFLLSLLVNVCYIIRCDTEIGILSLKYFGN